MRDKKGDCAPDCKACEWAINSPEHDNCFWVFVKARSDYRGQMPVMTLSEISKVMDIPQKKINQIYKSALDNLQEHEEFEDLIEAFRD